MRKPRMCMVVHGSYPSGESRVTRETRVAVAQGFDVEIIALLRAGEPRRERVESARVHRLPIQHARGVGGVRLFAEYISFTVLAGLVLAYRSVWRRYDLIHLHNPPDFLIAATWIPRLAGVRVIFDAHDLSPDMFQMRFPEQRGTSIALRILKFVERMACAHAHVVVTVHEPYRRELIARGVASAKTTVVMNSVDETLLPATDHHSFADDDVFRIVYHGTLTPHYGLPTVVAAFASVSEAIPHARLEIYGEGDDVPHIRSQIEALGLTDRVTLTDHYLAQAEVLRRIAGASVGVVPNLDIPLNRFALSTKLFEYVALGIPVAASDLATLREHFSDDELRFFDPGDAAALAEALVEMSRYPATSARRAGAAKARYEDYRWHISAARYRTILSSLVPAAAGPDESTPRRVLILVENLSVPFDRRVWQESKALHRAGYEVVVVCPQANHVEEPSFEILEGIEIHRFPLEPARFTLDYVREYFQAAWRIRRIARRLAATRTFDVVQTCNPPDFLNFVARSLRRRGARFVFDHHDLVPELFESRFGRRGFAHRMLLAMERASMRKSDVVIATNESYRRIALERGGTSPNRTFVVRNAPEEGRLVPVAPEPELRRGHPYLIAYLGLMGRQDGVESAIRALGHLRASRDDWHAIFMGDGEVVHDVQRLASELGIADVVEFTGRVGDEMISRVLSTADVCLSPEPPSPLNDVSTLTKVVEYMTMGCPIVAFDLPETRTSAGPAALYANGGEEEFARCIDALLDDPDRRAEMGAVGYERATTQLSWSESERQLLAAFDRALGLQPMLVAEPRIETAGTKVEV